MPLISEYLFPAIWLGYFTYWFAISRNVKATERLEPTGSRLMRLVVLGCVAALLSQPTAGLPLLDGRFLPVSARCFWIGAALTSGGLLFSVWARRHLGTNWSQAVTLKADHELITSGPYALVRHPIYTGLLAALLGSAIALGEWRGLLAVALAFGTFWHKLRMEENWMRSQFGDAYETYSRRVARLVPYIF